MEGREVRLEHRNSFDQIFMALYIGEPPDRSDDQGLRGTAKPIRLLFSLNPCLDEPLPIDSTGDHSEPVGRTDIPIEMILPFRFCESNHSIREHTQDPFNLKKQPGSKWTEMTVEHMAVGRMDNDRHLGHPRCYSP